MNKQKIIYVLFLTSLFTIKTFAQNSSTCEQAYMIVKTAEKFHYNPRPVNDNFAELVFSRMIDLLDYKALIFTKEDIENLEQIKLEIDDNILNKECTFLQQITQLYYKRLIETDSLILSFNNKKIDFNKKDSVIFQKDNISLNRFELSNKWEKELKMKIILSCLPDNDSTVTVNDFSSENISKMKSNVIERESCKLKSKYNSINGTDKYLSSVYLDAIAFSFDPHTKYLSGPEKNEFEALMSEESGSFGFELSVNEKGQIKIEKMYPGSPAWNSNQINEGDVILEISLKDGTRKSFDCIDLKNAVLFISSGDLKEATFHILKKDKREVDVTLIKKRIKVDENVINSFILDGNRKIGYINLPVFYSQFDSIKFLPNGCANDVAKEIIKLKREGIEGLIFDLRNNGGGSMLEAVRMAGIFIDYGALGIIHSHGTKPITLKDTERGVVYAAPLVIMINSYSASASEFFAAAMQDYNRAVLAGSKTFGKSTAQIIIPTESFKYENLLYSESTQGSYLKLTISKFFRVTGKSHQKEGIIPDIEFYDNDNFFSERDYLSSLESSSIDKKTYYFPLDSLPLSELNKRSKNRLIRENTGNNRQTFELTGEQSFSVPLDITSFIDFYNERIVNNDPKINSPFKVSNFDYIKGFHSLKDSESEINENVMNDIKRDRYIIETFYIINDLIELNSK